MRIKQISGKSFVLDETTHKELLGKYLIDIRDEFGAEKAKSFVHFVLVELPWKKNKRIASWSFGKQVFARFGGIAWRNSSDKRDGPWPGTCLNLYLRIFEILLPAYRANLPNWRQQLSPNFLDDGNQLGFVLLADTKFNKRKQKPTAQQRKKMLLSHFGIYPEEFSQKFGNSFCKYLMGELACTCTGKFVSTYRKAVAFYGAQLPESFLQRAVFKYSRKIIDFKDKRSVWRAVGKYLDMRRYCLSVLVEMSGNVCEFLGYSYTLTSSSIHNLKFAYYNHPELNRAIDFTVGRKYLAIRSLREIIVENKVDTGKKFGPLPTENAWEHVDELLTMLVPELMEIFGLNPKTRSQLLLLVFGFDYKKYKAFFETLREQLGMSTNESFSKVFFSNKKTVAQKVLLRAFQHHSNETIGLDASIEKLVYLKNSSKKKRRADLRARLAAFGIQLQDNSKVVRDFVCLHPSSCDDGHLCDIDHIVALIRMDEQLRSFSFSPADDFWDAISAEIQRRLFVLVTQMGESWDQASDVLGENFSEEFLVESVFVHIPDYYSDYYSDDSDVYYPGGPGDFYF
mmetsp:Transcript_36848/g.59693  ORF Transcript_36848/g.59693 Transcript_36848/m.59693 type:complete len:568 (-) Transcript_36848:711-2414(-)